MIQDADVERMLLPANQHPFYSGLMPAALTTSGQRLNSPLMNASAERRHRRVRDFETLNHKIAEHSIRPRVVRAD